MDWILVHGEVVAIGVTLFGVAIGMLAILIKVRDPIEVPLRLALGVVASLALVSAAFVYVGSSGETHALASTPSAIASASSVSGPVTTPSPPTLPPAPAVSTCLFALAGNQYASLSAGSSVSNDPYRAVWTDDGRLWQPDISTLVQPSGYSILAEIPAGNYIFNGVIATAYRDDAKAAEPMGLTIIASDGNGIQFSIVAGRNPAWILVVGSGGFEIYRVGNLC